LRCVVRSHRVTRSLLHSLFMDTTDLIVVVPKSIGMIQSEDGRYEMAGSRNTGPTTSATATLRATFGMVVGVAIGFVPLVFVVILLPDKIDLVVFLAGCALLGSLAAELVEMTSNHPTTLQSGPRSMYRHYVQTFNLARFLWRVASWSMLATAGYILAQLLKS